MDDQMKLIVYVLIICLLIWRNMTATTQYFLLHFGSKLLRIFLSFLRCRTFALQSRVPGVGDIWLSVAGVLSRSADELESESPESDINAIAAILFFEQNSNSLNNRAPTEVLK